MYREAVGLGAFFVLVVSLLFGTAWRRPGTRAITGSTRRRRQLAGCRRPKRGAERGRRSHSDSSRCAQVFVTFVYARPLVACTAGCRRCSALMLRQRRRKRDDRADASVCVCVCVCVCARARVRVCKAIFRLDRYYRKIASQTISDECRVVSCLTHTVHVWFTLQYFTTSTLQLRTSVRCVFLVAVLLSHVCLESQYAYLILMVKEN
jgi:hypothetical protein